MAKHNTAATTATTAALMAANTAATATAMAATVGTTLHFRRLHPGGGPLGRCSYGIPGVPGIVVFDMGMFVGGIAPATIVLPLAMAAPVARKVAGVTSAVVQAANVAVAQATAAPVAQPPTVATTAAQAAQAVVKAAGAGQAHAAKVG